MPTPQQDLMETDERAGTGSTILVAEDHAETRSLLRFVLEREGYRVVEAETGTAAVALAEGEVPDLILTDLHMPGLNGVEVVRRIRSIARLSNVPILAMSGDGRQGMELFLNIDQLGGGFIDYIAKPLNLDSVLEQINELLVHEALSA